MLKCLSLSKIFRDGLYDLDFKNPKSDKSKWLNMDQLTAVYEKIITDFPIVSFEDPFDQNHWEAWTKINSKYPKLQVPYSKTIYYLHSKNIFFSISTSESNQVKNQNKLYKYLQIFGIQF